MKKKFIKKVGKVQFYDNRVSWDFPHVNNNLYLFEISTDTGKIRTDTFGYGFKRLDLINTKEEKLNDDCFQIFSVHSTQDHYPNSRDFAGNDRKAQSWVLYGIVCDEENAKIHCKKLSEKLRGEKVEELLEDERRNQKLSNPDREVYGKLEVIIR